MAEGTGDGRIGQAAISWLVGALGAGLVCVALAWFPFRRWGGEPAIQSLLAGAAVALAGAALGALPVLQAMRARELGGKSRMPTGFATAGLASALRSGGTLVLALVVVLGSGISRRPFLAAVGIGYLVLLIVETKWTLRWLRAGDSR